MGVSAKKKIKPCEEKWHKFYSYCQVSLTVVLLSCIQVNDVHVFQCLTFSDRRENQPQKCYWTKKKKTTQKNEKGKKESWNWQKYSVYYSVVDICCQKLHIAMVISKIKCGILSHTCGLLGLSCFFLRLGEMSDWSESDLNPASI